MSKQKRNNINSINHNNNLNVNFDRSGTKFNDK